MKWLFDQVSTQCSRMTTRAYSTSFSAGIYFLRKDLRDPVYAIYGFVRFADEIVDSFEGYDKKYLLQKFKADTYEAIEAKISLNPILNSFQHVIHQYEIDLELIEIFLNSMEMDLEETAHSRSSYDRYILGSAEVVGLMCLCVFTEGCKKKYAELKPYAMKLGSAFQKVNFLRDLKADYQHLGRSYFPNVDLSGFSLEAKREIEKEIDSEFKEALVGIKKLPSSSRGGVYLAYVYYYSLFKKIRSIPAQRIMQERIRISNGHKLRLMFNSMLQFKLNTL